MADTPDRRFERTRAVMRFMLAVFYYIAGFAHLTSPGDFVAMIPWLPAPHTIVMLTGWAELLGATGLLIPRVRRLAGIMLALYAVCVFPANIYQAFAHVPFGGKVFGWNAQALRFALQPVFVWWALFSVNVIDWPFRKAQPISPQS